MGKTRTLAEEMAAQKPPEELLALRSELRSLRQRVKEYKRAHGDLEGMMQEVIASVPVAAPVAIERVRGKIPEGKVFGAVLHLSDIHYGAMQDSDEVEGFGSFSPEQARARLINLTNDFLDWISLNRKGYNIPVCHVLMTGDYVSGDIHEELKVTNAFPTPVQAVECGCLMSSILLQLAKNFPQVRVHIVTDDNHGRMTKKPQAKQAGLNNWSYVVARWIQQQMSAQMNVMVNPILRPWESVECSGRRYLLTHGHHVRGWMGFPYYTLDRLAAKEALKRMNASEIRKFHRLVLGHWHAPMEHQNYWIGGSVSGTDAYDHSSGRHAAPMQVSWLINPDKGEFNRTEWTLRDS